MNISQSQKIIVRYPPSPTGEPHIGNIRTLLFNYLFAKKMNGHIVMRFEDTDKERNKDGAEEAILKGLAALGLTFDEGPYRQSERTEIYRRYLHLLVEKGLAYEAQENAAQTGKVIRIKNIERNIVWQDLIKGEISINTHTFKDESGNADIVIARSIDDPLYHFTVVVDDWLMGVTHVIRGDDHITSTPRQIMIIEALSALEEILHEEGVAVPTVPVYGHLPTIIGDDKKKLSKRNGKTSLNQFFDLGYLPETMVNYLALLGWNPGDERELFTLEELVAEFSFERCQKSPAQFDFKKLDSINKHYLSKADDESYFKTSLDFFDPEERKKITDNMTVNKKVIIDVLRPRAAKYMEIVEAYRAGEVNMFFPVLWKMEVENFDVQKLLFKGQSVEENRSILVDIKNKLENLKQDNWNLETLKNALFDWAGTLPAGRGAALHPLRTLLSLRDRSPDPFTIMDIIGKAETMRRFDLILK